MKQVKTTSPKSAFKRKEKCQQSLSVIITKFGRRHQREAIAQSAVTRFGDKLGQCRDLAIWSTWAAIFELGSCPLPGAHQRNPSKSARDSRAPSRRRRRRARLSGGEFGSAAANSAGRCCAAGQAPVGPVWPGQVRRRCSPFIPPGCARG